VSLNRVRAGYSFYFHVALTLSLYDEVPAKEREKKRSNYQFLWNWKHTRVAEKELSSGCTKFRQLYLIRQTYRGTCLRILYKIGRHQDNEEERRQTNSSGRTVTSIEDPILMVYRKSPYTW
jgi:hypothetical protein